MANADCVLPTDIVSDDTVDANAVIVVLKDLLALDDTVAKPLNVLETLVVSLELNVAKADVDELTDRVIEEDVDTNPDSVTPTDLPAVIAVVANADNVLEETFVRLVVTVALAD